MFELSGDDEINNRAEAEEHDTEALIERIFEAAAECRFIPNTPEAWKAADKMLCDAIDRAMSHAYAEGRADEHREWVDKELREKTKLAMSTHTSDAMTEIWNLTPRRVA